MNTQFNKAIQDLRNIKMTSAEKQAVLKRVLSAPMPAGIDGKASDLPVRSPWTVYSFGIWIRSHRAVSAIVAVAVVIFGSGSAVSASYSALPGDLLYPVKVSVSEPIRVALAISDEAKADIQAKLVQNRLQEAEMLAARGALDGEKEQKIDHLVTKQVSKLSVVMEKVRAASPERADDIQTTIDASINAHTRLLSVLSGGRKQLSAATAGPAAMAPIAPIAASSLAAPETMSAKMAVPPEAARSAVSAGDEQDLSDGRDAPNSKSKGYEKKKTSVESLIQAAAIDLDATSTDASSTVFREILINDARTNLGHAKDKLEEAARHGESGEDDKAYSALLESERAAKEAAIFIQARTRLEKEVNNEEMVKPGDASGSVQGVSDERKGDDQPKKGKGKGSNR